MSGPRWAAVPQQRKFAGDESQPPDRAGATAGHPCLVRTARHDLTSRAIAAEASATLSRASGPSGPPEAIASLTQ